MRIFHQKSSSEAKKYYSASDYYESGPEQLKGTWFGNGAELLGLSGEVDQIHFDRLVDNLHPFEDKRLTQRNHAERRVLTDVTFSAPKSVSIMFGITEDSRILDAVQEAAFDTFADLEKDVQTRVNHKRGVLTFEKTNNLIGAGWLHVTGRPEDDPVHGVHSDMQLHVHGAILNATHTGNNRWTAIDLSDVVRDSGYFEALFQSRLATNMNELGYSVERSEHNFEVSGVSRETIEKFSRRSTEINELVKQGAAEKIAAKDQISIADAKDQLGQRSRKAKASYHTLPELSEIWRQRLTPEETQTIEAIANGDHPKPNRKQVTPKEAVDFAIDHRFEKEAVTRERHLVRDALYHSIADVPTNELLNEVKSRPWIREGEGSGALISTREVLEEEQALLKFARKGRGSVTPLAPDHQIDRQWLSDEQKQAVNGLLKSKDRMQILRGVAGVGKTTLMSEAIEGIKKAGTNVSVLAPGTIAVHEVLADEGFAANTLASFLKDERVQQEARNGVIWLDEAGQAGTQDIAKLARIAEKLDSRIILSGDKNQHKSVARGAPLRLLEEQAGIKPQEVTKIRRQSGDYRDAVACLSRGDVVEGFDRLNKLEFVHQVQDGDKRNKEIAKSYVDNIEAGKETLVIAPTHAERAVVTDAIRSELKSRGHIHGDDYRVNIMKSRGLSEAERTDAFRYSKGDVIEFVTKGKGGFKSGDRLRVIENDGDQVLADSEKGMVRVPIESPKSFDVYQWQESKFAAGDQIRITKKNKAKKLYNGTLVRLDGFTDDGQLKLSNGQTVSTEWGHIDHGITVTSHASQGKTYKRVIVAQSSTSFPASSPEQIYVSASRGEERVDIFTDDIHGLRRAINRSSLPQNSSDIAHQNPFSEMKHRLMNRTNQLRLRTQESAIKQLQRIQQWIQTASPQHAR